MPPIAGASAFQADPALASRVEGIARRLALSREPPECALAVAGKGCLAFVAQGAAPCQPQIAASADRGLLVVGDGYITQPSAALAQSTLQLYRDRGLAFAEQLQGCFAVALWDSRQQRLLLATDPVGTRPVYYAVTQHHAFFASSTAALLAEPDVPRRVNMQALCEYVTLGFPLHDRMLLADVRLVPPGSVVSIECGHATVRRYRRIQYGASASQTPNLNRCAEQMNDRFLTAVRDQTAQPGCYALPLSGGLDSRCIAAALHRCGRQVQTLTIGSDGAADLTLADIVAKRLGFAHHAWTVSPRDFLAWVEEGVRLTDGTLGAFDTHILFVARRLPADTQAVLDGVASCDGLYSRFEVAAERLAPRSIARRLPRHLFIAPIIDPAHAAPASPSLFAQHHRPVVAEHLAASLNQIRDDTQDAGPSVFDRFDYTDLTQRIRRFNLVGSVLLRAYCPTLQPFFHPDVFSLVTQWPPQWRAREKPIQRKLLHRLVPQLDDVPWERTELPPGANILRILACYAERKARSRFSPRRQTHSPRRGVAIDYRRWLLTDPALKDFVRDLLLGPRHAQRGYFEPARVRTLVEGQITGRTDQLALLGRLISLELWHRFFLDAPGAPEHNLLQRPAAQSAVVKR
ncbi:MAG TPA: asparagine synthase-related protein [Phycisphaerae bacterium]|nr:asparagine synthase-related protein [Phycisphaerae bacterium]